jgi:hypothetical protein
VCIGTPARRTLSRVAKRKSVDDAYKTLMERILDSKKSYDPWGNIRSKETTSSKQRNEVK